MGSKISTCIRIDSLKNDNYEPSSKDSSTLNKNKKLLDLSKSPKTEDTGSTETTISNRSLSDIREAIDQIFILCETGVASTIQFIINAYPEIESLINERHSCHVSDIEMELTPLQLSAACGHSHVVELLLSCTNININLQEKQYMMTAIHLAVALGQSNITEILCKDSRINLNVKNIDGKTALHLAIELEDVNSVEMITRLKPNLDLRKKDFDA